MGDNLNWVRIVPWSEPRGFIAVAAACALFLLLPLALISETPRARLNVAEMCSLLFFLILISRLLLARQPTEGLAAQERSAKGLLLALTLASGLYAATLPLYFISDDYTYLVHAESPMFESLWVLLTQGQAGVFLRPVGFATLFVDYRLWELWHPGFHLTSILFHLATTAGIFFLLEGLGQRAETCAAGSLIFAVLPIQVEAVSWMGGRFDVVATCLTVWALVYYVRFREAGHISHLLFALVFFLLGMLSKENAYILPLLLIALEFLVMPIRNMRLVGPFLLLATIVFVYRWIVLGGIGGYASPSGLPATFDIGLQTFEGLLGRAPAQMLLGYNWLQPPLFEPIVLVSLTGAMLLALVLGTSSCSSAKGLTWFGLTWIVLSNLPAHPLILVGADLTNSRVFYLGSAGLAIVIALLLTGISHTRLRRCWTGLLVLFLGAGLLHNVGARRWTADLSKGFLSELRRLEPSPPANAEFVFRDLPDKIRGVFFFNEGLTEALNILYQRQDLRGRRESDPLSSPLEVAAGKPLVELRWVGEKGRLLERIRN
ncbi:MAG: glycosyltransferase family 39 protein [Acidobacteria bacterium]|nr:glycosyltransferase family 39 protein [Acidobacteriota bacterium]